MYNVKKLSFFLAFVVALLLGDRGLLPPAAVAQQPPRPNIVYILADDLG
jgi:hypothetical protein